MGVLTGRIALVTVDSDGIGAEIARVFAAEGAAVAVHGHDPEAVEIVVEEIRWEGGRATSPTPPRSTRCARRSSDSSVR